MVRCDIRKAAGRKKVVTESQRQRKGKELGVARVEEGAVSALSYYFHLPFPELSEVLCSKPVWAETCLHLSPSSSSEETQGQ